MQSEFLGELHAIGRASANAVTWLCRRLNPDAVKGVGKPKT
jgi:hypothetical protein